MSIEVFGCIFFGRIFSPANPGGEKGGKSATLRAGPMDRSQIEKISRALADATRLRIYEAISASKHMNCGEIVSMRGVTPATVSHHLKILSEAGLIACRRQGQFVYSEAVPETVESYTHALTKMTKRRKSAN